MRSPSPTTSDSRPRIAVVTFPGSQDDRDAVLALAALGAEPVQIWHAEPAMEAVGRFAEQGGLVLGICNGFQILCEAGLLPGVLRPTVSLSFVCRDVPVRVERTDTAFTSRCEPGQRLVVPVKHGEGCWYADDELQAELEANGQIVLRYDRDNPNGSVAGVSGVINRAGTVMGLMPHPEHAVDPLLGSTDGALILESLLDAVRERAAVPA